MVVLHRLLAPTVAHAYIDPGSGSFVLQGIIAAILGAGVTLKLFWRRLFGKGGGTDDDDDQDDRDGDV